MYKLYYFKGDSKKLLRSVKNFDWKNDVPGGWLDYSPPRKVTGYGNGLLYKDSGKSYGKKWSLTSWSASVPFTDSTAVVETKKIPENFIDTGIIKETRDCIRDFGGYVDDYTGTGLWCNYYEKQDNSISGHTDDENYYERNYLNRHPLFVSLTLYEDGSKSTENMSKFQIKENGKWNSVPLPHLSLLVMSGDIEHRVLKYGKKNNFRKRFNITFRTPVSRENDIVKNYRFFSNFGRYYNHAFLLFVPDIVFVNRTPPICVLLEYFTQKKIVLFIKMKNS